MTNLVLRIAALAVLTALALPMSAIAASSEEAYGGPNNVVSGVQGGETGPSPSVGGDGSQPTANVASVAAGSDDSGLLPFTGADLAILASAGLVLLGLGYGLRRVTRHPSQL